MNIFISNSLALISRTLRQKIIDGLQNAKWSFFTNKPHGIIINLLSQEVDKAVSLFNVLITLSVCLFMLIIYLTLGVNISIELLILAIFLSFIGFFIAKPMFRMAKKAGQGQVNSLRDIASDLSDGIRSYKSFKAMAKERKLMASLTNSNNSFQNAALLNVKAQHFLNFSQQSLLILAVVLGVYFAKEIFKIDFAELGVIIVILARMNAYSSTFFKKLQSIVHNVYVLEKYDEFENDLYNNQESYKNKKEVIFPKKIIFKNVTFTYDKEEVLKDINLIIPMSGLTVIMGESGTGKTTLIDLICGFYKITKGMILLDSQNIENINIRSWRNYIGYSSQESNLLNKNIADNIKFFDFKITKEEIKNILNLSGIENIDTNFSSGIDTVVGEGSGKISGGEKQRINIAMALAKKPKLIILDEPTSSLDKKTANNLIKTIEIISKKIPIIVVTHQSDFKKIANNFIDLKKLL